MNDICKDGEEFLDLEAGGKETYELHAWRISNISFVEKCGLILAIRFYFLEVFSAPSSRLCYGRKEKCSNEIKHIRKEETYVFEDVDFMGTSYSRIYSVDCFLYFVNKECRRKSSPPRKYRCYSQSRSFFLTLARMFCSRTNLLQKCDYCNATTQDPGGGLEKTIYVCYFELHVGALHCRPVPQCFIRKARIDEAPPSFIKIPDYGSLFFFERAYRSGILLLFNHL